MTILYGVTFVVLVGLTGLACQDAVRWAVAELDLSWMIPSLLRGTEHQPLERALAFIFSVEPPKLAFPVIKAYLYTILSLLQLHTRHLIFLAMFVHFVNSIMVYGVGSRLGLGKRTAFFSACIHLTVFAHFHAYLWPTASTYHLFSVFQILLILQMYLIADSRIQQGQRVGPWYGLTLAAGLLGSIGRGSMMAPLLLFSHGLLSRGSAQERAEHLRRWTPFYFLFSLYPIYWLLAIPEDHGNHLLEQTMVLLAAIPAPSGFKWVGLVFMVLALLQVLRWGVGRLNFKGSARVWAAVGAGMLLAVTLLFALVDKRQLLFPYNAAIPLLAMLTSTLEPIRSVLAMDASQPLHPVVPGVGPFNLLLLGGMVCLFATRHLSRNRLLGVLGVWYGVTLVHFLQYYSSQPIAAPSRYYVYVAPVFAWMFASVLLTLFDASTVGIRRKPLLREGLLVGLVVALGVSNLSAIRLVTWRGRLTNNFYTYDDFRTASLIKQDVESRQVPWGPERKLSVRGVVPMPYDAPYWTFMRVNPEAHRMFRFVMEEVWQKRSLGRIEVLTSSESAPADSGGSFHYAVEGSRVVDAQGQPVDRFHQLWDEAMQQLKVGEEAAAKRLFEQALEESPFLLTYLLSEKSKLSDLRWLTGGRGLRPWLDQVREHWSRLGEDNRKYQQTWAVISQELWELEWCLFALSVLADRAGEEQESGFWMSQLRYIEPDLKRLRADLLKADLLSSNRKAAQLLKTLPQEHWFQPYPGDSSFGRFLLRRLLGWDVRSLWEGPRVPNL